MRKAQAEASRLAAQAAAEAAARVEAEAAAKAAAEAAAVKVADAARAHAAVLADLHALLAERVRCQGLRCELLNLCFTFTRTLRLRLHARRRYVDTLTPHYYY
jgi:hypothetical protein